MGSGGLQVGPRLRRVASFGLVWALTGCSLLPWGSRTIAPCSGVLRSTEEIDGEFVVQLRVRIRAGELDFPMRLVVQKTAGELVAIGFNPFGAKLFTVVQRGVEVKVDALPRAVLPVAPMNVVRDLHRIRFLMAPRPDDGTGVSTRSFDGIVVSDTWKDGALVRRELRTTGHSLPTTLRFEPSSSTVAISNPGCGYSSEWTTVSEELIR